MAKESTETAALPDEIAEGVVGPVNDAVKLANTVAMKRYDGLKHSDDETDAAYLAHLLRLGILPTCYTRL